MYVDLNILFKYCYSSQNNDLQLTLHFLQNLLILRITLIEFKKLKIVQFERQTCRWLAEIIR